MASLSVSGSAPPSRGSRAGTSSGNVRLSAKTAENPVDALTQVLIKKMRDKFGELSNDVKSQEIIAKEVLQFMSTEASVREGDISNLEDRIRARLSGETPPRQTLASMKRAQQEGDEWARIYALHIVQGKEKDAAERAVAAAKAASLQQVLAQQIADKKAAEEAEKREEIEYFHREQQDLAQWEAEEKRKAQLQKDIMDKLKADREAQLQERQLRKRMAQEKAAAEDAELAARLAYEAKMEFEAEEETRRRDKESLKTFLLNNEIYKSIKEEAKKKEWEFDQTIMNQYADMLDKQEKARQAQLEKLKEWQAKQEREAAARPEAKRWIDPAIVEKYTREADAAAAAEDARRQAAVKESNRRLAADLAVQMKEREVAKKSVVQEEQKVVEDLKKQVAAEQARRQAEKDAEAAKKAALKASLEQQMKLHAKMKVVAPMSDTEKQINAKLLQQVQAAAAAGTLKSTVGTIRAGGPSSTRRQ